LYKRDGDDDCGLDWEYVRVEGDGDPGFERNCTSRTSGIALVIYVEDNYTRIPQQVDT
jgi:hypothetical protein